jgi:hypothetical protein
MRRGELHARVAARVEGRRGGGAARSGGEGGGAGRSSSGGDVLEGNMCASTGGAAALVGLYTLNPVDPELATNRFQP